jgi:hypothetical protein
MAVQRPNRPARGCGIRTIKALWIARLSTRTNHSPVTFPTSTKKVRLTGSTRGARGITSPNNDALLVRDFCNRSADLPRLGETVQGVGWAKVRSAGDGDHASLAGDCESDRSPDATGMDE